MTEVKIKNEIKDSLPGWILGALQVGASMLVGRRIAVDNLRVSGLCGEP